MSLGATSRDVLQDVIVRGMRPVFWGMLAGIVLAGIASLIFRWTLQFPGSLDFLYGVPFYDPLSFIGLSVFVLFLAALASLIPAIRALRVDPMVALRHE
jgi:putative ABC transport system permease protein